MARSEKYNKNLQRVQNILEDKHERKIKVGQYNPTDEKRKVGDKWTDSDGQEWEQKEGYRVKVKSTPNVGIFSKVCKDCEKPCINKRDVDTYTRMDRCFKCQVDFEALLKSKKIGKNNSKWFFWVKLKMLQRWTAIDKESNLIALEMMEENKKLFDKSVANALANAEVDTSMQVNKKLTGG